MTQNSKLLALGLAGGYLLGRTRKAKIALAVASYVLGKRQGLSPQHLLTEGLKKLNETPEFARLNEQLRGELMSAGRSVVTAAANRSLDSLSDSLRDRTAALSSQDEEDDEDQDEGEGEGEEPEDRREGEEPEDEGEGEEPGNETGKAAGGKAPPRRAAPEKPPAKKAPVKRAPAKKAAPKESTAGKSASRKTAATKSTARGSAAKKAAPRSTGRR